MGPSIVNVFFQVYQQDATLYNILYYCQCSTCFGRFLRSSSGAQNCTHSIWYISSLLVATASVSELESVLMMNGETVRNMWNIDSNKEYCITLLLVGILERTYVHFALNLFSELTGLLSTANYITKGARE
jgi:hypothetical protein